MCEPCEPNETLAILHNAQKRATALAYQLDLVVDQLATLHNRACNLATLLKAIVGVETDIAEIIEVKGTNEDRSQHDDPK